MNPIVNLYRITKELQNILAEPVQKDKREEFIETVTSLLDEREQLITEVKPPYTEEESKLGNSIVELNKLIDGQLLTIKQDIHQDIKQLKKSKESTTKYINPYQSEPSDGMFFDKRK